MPSLNTPNKLTLLRIALVPFFVAFLLVENVTDRRGVILTFRLVAFFVFVIAALTDLLDGYLARRHGLVTNFGKLMDPLADKLLTMAAFVAFVEIRIGSDQPVFPAWAIIVILAREFLVTGLRALALEHRRLIQADHLGKHKTIWQLIGIAAVLAALCFRDWLRLTHPEAVPICDRWLSFGCAMVLLLILSLTVASGIQYLWKNRDLLQE